MKCFECKKEITNELEIEHVEDGDFVHTDCLKKYEENRQEFFDNIHDDKFYNDWLKK